MGGFSSVSVRPLGKRIFGFLPAQPHRRGQTEQAEKQGEKWKFRLSFHTTMLRPGKRWSQSRMVQ